MAVAARHQKLFSRAQSSSERPVGERWREREREMLGTISSKPLIKDGLRRNVLMMDCSRPVGRRRRPRRRPSVRPTAAAALYINSLYLFYFPPPRCRNNNNGCRIITHTGELARDCCSRQIHFSSFLFQRPPVIMTASSFSSSCVVCARGHPPDTDLDE